MLVLPADRERLVHLHVLARLDAAAAENALAGIVAVKRIAVVDRIRLLSKRDLPLVDGQKFRRVVHRAIAVIVVADRAVKLMVAEDPTQCLALGGGRRRRLRQNLHAVRYVRRARPDELAIHLDHARVAGLDRAKLRVVADLRQLNAGAIDYINQAFAGTGLLPRAVQGDRAHVVH